MSQAVYDVAIVGAGIVCAACAHEIAHRGMSVVILDRDVVGSGATAAGMGHIVVMDDSEAQLALTRYSQQLWRALKPELPADVEYEECGTIWVAADEEELMRKKWSRYSASTITTLRTVSPPLCSTRIVFGGSSPTCARGWLEVCSFRRMESSIRRVPLASSSSERRNAGEASGRLLSRAHWAEASNVV